MDLVGRRYWFFLISGLVILAGIISMLIPPAFQVGIDFTGGAAITVEFERPVDQGELEAFMAQQGHPEAIPQRLGKNRYFIRTRPLAEAQRDESGQVVKPGEKELLRQALEKRFGPIKEWEFSSVSPAVAAETVNRAVFAVLAAALAILVYVSWSFRRVSNPFRMGVAAIVALVHDVLVTLGIFSILGKFFPLEVNSMFITGVLTVVGYSVHDTIVVFDRIRENSARGVAPDLEGVINASLVETMGRSLNTSITTLIVILALFLIGGPTIRTLLVTLLIGLIAGTYSSIAIASQFLVVWERGEWLGPWSRKRKEAAATA